jgi:hypothetical protein
MSDRVSSAGPVTGRRGPTESIRVAPNRFNTSGRGAVARAAGPGGRDVSRSGIKASEDGNFSQKIRTGGDPAGHYGERDRRRSGGAAEGVAGA